MKSQMRAVYSHMRKLALKQKTMLRLLMAGGTFGIISAYSTGPRHENRLRHGKLIGDLQQLGYRKMTTLKGQWEGTAEKSILIPNIKPQHLFALGRKYGQDAVIYKSKDEIVGMYYPAKGYAEIAVDPSDISPATLSDNKDLFSKTRNWSFELGFMWGKHLPWNGHHPISRKEIRAEFS